MCVHCIHEHVIQHRCAWDACSYVVHALVRASLRACMCPCVYMRPMSFSIVGKDYSRLRSSGPHQTAVLSCQRKKAALEKKSASLAASNDRVCCVCVYTCVCVTYACVCVCMPMLYGRMGRQEIGAMHYHSTSPVPATSRSQTRSHMSFIDAQNARRTHKPKMKYTNILRATTKIPMMYSCKNQNHREANAQKNPNHGKRA